MSNIKNRLSLTFIFLFSIVLLDAKGQDSIYFFQAKSDISIQREGKIENFTAHIRFNLKDTLWISFTGTLGIEGMRMMVTPDSTYIINKLENTAFSYTTGEETEFIPYSFSFEDWKMILLNMNYQKDSNTNYITEDSKEGYIVYQDNQSKKVISKNNKIEKCYFNHSKSTMTCVVEYSDFEAKKNKYELATARKINIKNSLEDNVLILIKYVDYKFNIRQPFVFNFAKYRNGTN